MFVTSTGSGKLRLGGEGSGAAWNSGFGGSDSAVSHDIGEGGSWQLVAWTSNAGCTGSRTAGPGGTFAPNGTGPLAVGLGGFSAVSGQGWSLLLGLVGLAAVAILMIRRRGQGAVAPVGR